MSIKIIWGNDLNAQNTFIKKLIDKVVSKEWKELNLTNFNGDDEEQINQSMDEILTPPLGNGSRVVILKNNPIFISKNENIRSKFEKIYKNIPNNNFFILQSNRKPDSRLKSTKFLQNLIKENLASEHPFLLPEIWDYEGQKNYLEDTAKKMDLKIDQDAAELIINSVGNDSYKLISELSKAKIFLNASKNKENPKLSLQKSDVKKIFQDQQSNIFKVIDLLLEKNINKSLIEIQNLMIKGEPPLKLNAGLISQIRMHAIVKISIVAGQDNEKLICNLAGISNPKRIFFIRKKVSNTKPEYLINLMAILLNIESLLKKGNNPISVFTENLINLS